MQGKIKCISSCLKRIVYLRKSGKQEGLLIPKPKGNEPFDTLHIDHFGPLEKTQFQHKYVLVKIDTFTKFEKLYPCTSTKRKIVTKHLQNYSFSYSKPLRIVSDRKTDFIEHHDIKHVLSPGVPRANGQVEVVNKSVREMYGKFKHQNRTALRNGTKFTPSQLLIGVHQRGKYTDNVRMHVDSAYQKPRDLDQMRHIAINNMEVSQETMKTRYDRKHKTRLSG